MVDGHQCMEVEIEAELLQESHVSPIIIVNYLCKIYKEVKEEMEMCMTTIFANNYRWLVIADLVEKLCGSLKRAGVTAIELGKHNHVAFEKAKDEIIVLTGRRNLELKRTILEVRMTVR